MAAYAAQRARTLSGGQQQRGAIARAMVQGARIILADEPIASLDPESARKVMTSLAQLNREDGVTVLVSLHQIAFARRYCPLVVALKEGLVVYDGPSADLTGDRLHAIYGADVTEFYADDGAYAGVATPGDAATARTNPEEKERPVIRTSMRLVNRSVLVLALLVTCASVQTPIAELTEVYFGIISTETSKALKEGFEPWLADMATFLGIPVKGFYAPDYAGVIEAMRFGKVHVAWFGNKSALEAVTRADGEVCAQTVDIHGNPGYWSLIVAHKDSPYNTIDELIAAGKKLKFGHGDPNSTSGFLVPAYYLWAPRGLDPNTHFGMVRTANHETNLLAVVNKQV
jgi:phosphate/phosphite/phosphonate ABC transporter binding protein